MARRPRRGKGGNRRNLVVAGGGAAVLAGAWAAELAGRYPGWAAAIGVLLVAALAGGLVLRYRVIQARRARFLAANAELEKVDRMSGQEFEHLVAERMIADGFRQVRRCGRAGDGGVDVTAVTPGGTRYAVQCKRYAGNVGAPEVRNFLGALANAFDGCTGVLVTSGGLTRQARQEAAAARQPLVVVERDLLADWLIGRHTLLPRRAPARR